MPVFQGSTEKAGAEITRKGYRVKGAWVNSAEADSVAAYYIDGHSITETSRRFGVSKVKVDSVIKSRGLTNGRKFQEARVEDQKKSAVQRLSTHLLETGFEYVGGYTDKSGKIVVRHLRCGQEFERSVDFCKRGNMVCRECQRREAEKLKAETMKSREAARLIEKDERIRRKQEELCNLLESECHVCTVCGSLFSIRDYMDSCGLRQIQHDPKYCSEACKRKYYNNN